MSRNGAKKRADREKQNDLRAAMSIAKERLEKPYQVPLAGRATRNTLSVEDLDRIADKMERYQADMESKIAEGRKVPGRDGERLHLVEDQAADANVHTMAARNVANDPIEMLYSRKALTQIQHEAANRIRSDAEAATIGSNRAAPLGMRVQGGGIVGELTTKQLEAMRRYTICLERIGAIGGQLVRRIVLECRPLKETGDRLRMDKNYVAPRLREALDGVAQFYRL